MIMNYPDDLFLYNSSQYASKGTGVKFRVNPRVSCSQKDSTMQTERLRLDHPWAVTSNLEKVMQKHSQFKLISLIQIGIAFTLGD